MTSYLTTSDVAQELGVTPNTVRRWINDGRLPNPGRERRGARTTFAFSIEWLDLAKRQLGRTGLTAARSEAGAESGTGVVRLKVSADLGACDLGDVAVLLAGIERLYAVCYHAVARTPRPSVGLPPAERLWVVSLSMASPIHIVAAAKATSEAAKAADATAGLLNSAVTLGATRRLASAQAEVAANTVQADTDIRVALARKAVADAEAAEVEAAQSKVKLLQELVALGRDLDDEQVIASARAAARELLGPGSPEVAIDTSAQLALAVASETNALDLDPLLWTRGFGCHGVKVAANSAGV